MKVTPVGVPSTMSPGSTVALPMRIGMLMPPSVVLRIGVGSMPAAEERHVGQFADAVVVADAAVDDRARVRARLDRRREVVADERAFADFAVQVNHHHVVGQQRVDHPRVLPADAPVGFALLLHDVVKIGAVGQHLRGHGAPDQNAVAGWVLKPVALELEDNISRGRGSPTPARW